MFHARSLLLLLSCFLVGCATNTFVATLPADFDFDSPVSSSLFQEDWDFDSMYPKGATVGLAGPNPQFARELLSRTEPGSQVHLVDASNCRMMAVLLRVQGENVELMNCISKEVVAMPDGQQQCQTTHVPYKTLAMSTLTYCTVVAKPSPDFPTSGDGSQFTVDEIVFKDGSRHSWGKPLTSSPESL